MLGEFKAFLTTSNALALAIGVIIGASLGAVVNSLVNDIIMPPIGYALSGVNFEDIKWVLQPAEGGDPTTEVAVRFGAFLLTLITFVLVALVVFWIAKLFIREAEEAPAEASEEVRLLTEIRDALVGAAQPETGQHSEEPPRQSLRAALRFPPSVRNRAPDRLGPPPPPAVAIVAVRLRLSRIYRSSAVRDERDACGPDRMGWPFPRREQSPIVGRARRGHEHLVICRCLQSTEQLVIEVPSGVFVSRRHLGVGTATYVGQGDGGRGEAQGDPEQHELDNERRRRMGRPPRRGACSQAAVTLRPPEPTC